MEGNWSAKPIVEVLDGRPRLVPPVWLMRQAGRYLPEYQALRRRAGGFLDLCFKPDLAAEATLQPIRRFGFDAAILFSDILVVPHALGQRVEFGAAEGPRLEPVTDAGSVGRLRGEIDGALLEPVYEAIRLVKRQLPRTTALIGFCGAPWTVAAYMVAGRGGEGQIPARRLALEQPETFARLIELLTVASVRHLTCQLEAGVDAVQIFDTWAGALSPSEMDRWCIAPARQICQALRTQRPDARIIAFPRGVGTALGRYVDQVPVNAISLDWTMDLRFACGEIPGSVAIQGNLDPVALLAGGAAMDRQIDRILEASSGRPFIFNLGHGVLPETPIAHVERMLERVRGVRQASVSQGDDRV